MQVGTMSTGEKDDTGRPMGTIIASARGKIDDHGATSTPSNVRHFLKTH